MSRFTWIVALAVGCSSSSSPSGPPAEPAGRASVPRVDAAEVLAPVDGTPPPVVVVVDAAGALYVAAASSWDELGTRDPLRAARRGDWRSIDTIVREGFATGEPPRGIVGRFDVAPIAGAPDAPPPVTPPAPPEEHPESGVDLAITLDEGALERRAASARVEYRFKMPKGGMAELERIRARERWLDIAGPRGRLERAPPADDTARRLGVVVGEVADAGVALPKQRALIAAAPRSPATALIELLVSLEGLIAVEHGGRVRALRLQFLADPEESTTIYRVPRWLEVRVGRTEVAVEAPPDVPAVVPQPGGRLDAAALTQALAQAREGRGLDPGVPVDVLVEPDVDAQRLVDALVALDLAGARTIGLGRAPAPGSAEAALRGRRRVRVQLEPPRVSDGLDQALIRERLTGLREAFRGCYTTALVTRPTLEGKIGVQFLIASNGRVSIAEAVGVDPELAACMKELVRGLEFPKLDGHRGTGSVGQLLILSR